MSNSLLTISMITKESLRVLTGNLKFAANVSRAYNDEFAVKGAKIGQTINIRKPARYTGRTGAAVSLENHTETYTPLTLDQQYGVDLAFSSVEQTMSLDMYSDRVIKPAMANIASRIDAYVAAQALKVYNQVGTPGTALGSLTAAQRLDLALQAGVKLDNTLTPRDGLRSMIVDPAAQAAFAGAGLSLFNPAAEISEQYRSGKLTEALGFGFYMDQQLPTVAAPTYAGSPAVNGSNQVGASLITNGWSSSHLPVGTVFTIDGVFAVNPQTKATLKSLQQFVVTADATDSSGAMALSISPAIVATGAFQNVSRAPTTGDAINVEAASGDATTLSCAFHRDAFVAGWAELDVPGGVDMASRATDPETGVSVRIVRAYDVMSDRWVTRFDTLFGANTMYEQLACRVATA